MEEFEKFLNKVFGFYVGVKLFDIAVVLGGWLLVLYLFSKLVGQISNIFGF